MYAAIKRSYANDISASQKEAAYDKIMRDFVKTKRTKKTLSQKNVQLGSHQGRQYRMQYDDHAGDYILVFTGRSLYLFGVETENTTLLNSSRFLQSIKVN